MSSELLIALFAVLFGSLLTAVGLLVRRGWKRIQKERQMMLEAVAFVFGADEIGLNLEDESVEDRLQRGDRRFQAIMLTLKNIAETQENLIRKLDLEDEPPEVVEPEDLEDGRWQGGD